MAAMASRLRGMGLGITFEPADFDNDLAYVEAGTASTPHPAGAGGHP
ncbi:MAG: hypothetical protein R3A10_23400 [Caldilineaceae bacterium]